MPMIAAFELDDLVALGKTARETDARHCRFRPAVHHSHLFNRGNPAADQLGHFHFKWIWNSKTDSMPGCLTDCIDHYLWRMTEDRRSPSADIIDVFLPLDVANAGAGSAVDKERLATYSAKSAHG